MLPSLQSECLDINLTSARNNIMTKIEAIGKSYNKIVTEHELLNTNNSWDDDNE